MGECQVLASTSLGTYFEDIVPTIGHAPPDKCCNECAAHESCNSWTVVDFSAGADPQCHLKSATKHQAEEHKHEPGDKGWACPSGCDRTTDERFTSGFLIEPHDNSGGVVDEVGKVVGGWWLVLAVLSVTTIYVTVSRVSGRGWLWHGVWFANLGGLVKDGFAFCFGANLSRNTHANGYHPVRHDGAIGQVVQSQWQASGDQSNFENQGTKTSLLSVGNASTTALYSSSGDPNALHLAAAAGDAHRLRELRRTSPATWVQCLDKGDTHQYTPLHVAAAGGHAECVAALMEGGADQSLLNNQGMSGSEIARALRRTDVLELLNQASPSYPGGIGAKQPKEVSRPTTKRLHDSRELKAQLGALGLSTKGSKRELRARLAKAEARASGAAAHPGTSRGKGQYSSVHL